MTFLRVKVLSPSRSFLELDAKAVTVPGVHGYLTILPNHTTLISELGIGKISIKSSDGQGSKGSEGHDFFVSGGYVEIRDNNLVILGDVIENANAIELTRAESSKMRAKERLDRGSGRGSDQGFDVVRAQQSLKRAEERIFIAKTLGAVSKHH